MKRLPRRLAQSFYRRRADVVARALIGKTLLRETTDGIAGGVIVETEAYLSRGDPSCHAARGPTPRNQSMFGPPGRLYVYSIHAKYCLNAVTEREGLGSAVLIRAIEPVWGIELMQQRRGCDALNRLCRGPAMLCQALAIDTNDDGTSLTDESEIWIGRSLRRIDSKKTGDSPRIGISKATQLPLRYVAIDNPMVSGPRRLNG